MATSGAGEESAANSDVLGTNGSWTCTTSGANSRNAARMRGRLMGSGQIGAIDPLKGGGMGNAPIDVDWTIARDDAMKDVAKTGTVSAIAELAHSVHVDATGLEPDRLYWYRFRAAGIESPIGRTRTAPATAATSSCCWTLPI